MSKSAGLLDYLNPELLKTTLELARLFQDAGGNLLMVGGSVRDLIWREYPKELDFEARGLSVEEIKSLLSPHFKCDEVGKAFGVLKIKGQPIEIALPRTEIKTGSGHKGFSIDVDPNLPFEEAVLRRDFTINALGLNPLTDELFDPCRGRQDIADRILSHVGPAFKEDPLRVLRGMQFIARFQLTPKPSTIDICQSMDMENLAPERIYEEWKKLILKGVNLTEGLNFLQDTGWVKYFPELLALIGCDQEPEWHPEGDVWVHTLHCMDAFAQERVGDDWEDLVVGLAVLCHDLGKPLTTKIGKDGRIRSPMHEAKGEEPTRSFLSRLTTQVDLHEQVVPLVRRHLSPRTFYKDQAGDGAIRRLANKVKRIDRLVRVAAADIAGRPPRKDEFPEGPWLLQRAEELKVKDSAPQPIILGRHLIEHGLRPGPAFGPILKQCFEAQLDGAFQNRTEGVRFLKTVLEIGN
ncbi:MAG: polynucleotide adenylyltransferase [Verrucomicrobia bacterium TMED56]|nr:MAG: polynucleotide adenylyltransferase [Verrucomicrobia bacterium TMED56]